MLSVSASAANTLKPVMFTWLLFREFRARPWQLRENNRSQIYYTTNITYWNNYFLTRQIISIILDSVVIIFVWLSRLVTETWSLDNCLKTFIDSIYIFFFLFSNQYLQLRFVNRCFTVLMKWKIYIYIYLRAICMLAEGWWEAWLDLFAVSFRRQMKTELYIRL